MKGTVLITGASAGLGAEFARQLDSRATHFILVARRVDKLEALAETLKTPVTVIEQDLSKPGSPEKLCQPIASQGHSVDATGLRAADDADSGRVVQSIDPKHARAWLR